MFKTVQYLFSLRIVSRLTARIDCDRTIKTYARFFFCSVRDEQWAGFPVRLRMADCKTAGQKYLNKNYQAVDTLDYTVDYWTSVCIRARMSIGRI